MQKRKDAQEDETKIQCEGNVLENIYLCQNLGSVLTTNGSHNHDVKGHILYGDFLEVMRLRSRTKSPECEWCDFECEWCDFECEWCEFECEWCDFECECQCERE